LTRFRFGAKKSSLAAIARPPIRSDARSTEDSKAPDPSSLKPRTSALEVLSSAAIFMLADHAYGKSGVRLVQVTRPGDSHTLRDFTIAVAFHGDYAASYVEGSNAEVLPTDTMKNTVYALAARERVLAPEPFALALARHFLAGNPRLASVTIDVDEHLWDRISVDAHEHGHAFVRQGSGTRTARVDATRTRETVSAGIADLTIMKTGGSAFSGFMRDGLTTLPETRDRLLATSLTALWTYAPETAGFGPAWHAVRRTLLETFATHLSESVQHTLYAMGQAVLDAVADVQDIHIVMPNRHHIPVDLRPLGLENRSEIFVATTEPFGVIEATIRRG
jgi:urate oxidase